MSGCRAAAVWARLGAEVTVVEFLDNIVPTMVSASCVAEQGGAWPCVGAAMVAAGGLQSTAWERGTATFALFGPGCPTALNPRVPCLDHLAL